MKTLMILLLSVCSLVATAQNKTRKPLHQDIDIDDDGKMLSINISEISNGKTIKYNRQFDVTGMSKMAKETMIKHITDSLGINRTDHSPISPSTSASLSTRGSGNSAVHSSIKEHGDTMVINIKGTKDEKPLTYNRSFNVKGLTKQEKDAIVKQVTDSLGIGGPLQ